MEIKFTEKNNGEIRVLEDSKATSKEKIIITKKGRSVIAKYYGEGKTIQARSTCNKIDNFNFKIGANIAMQRLTDKITNINVGDYVMITNRNSSILGNIYKVSKIEGEFYFITENGKDAGVVSKFQIMKYDISNKLIHHLDTKELFGVYGEKTFLKDSFNKEINIGDAISILNKQGEINYSLFCQRNGRYGFVLNNNFICWDNEEKENNNYKIVVCTPFDDARLVNTLKNNDYFKFYLK